MRDKRTADLFDETTPVEPKTLARRSDPETSKAAARAIAPTLNTKQKLALKLVVMFPGETSAELHQRFRRQFIDADQKAWDSRAIGRRLPELEAQGYVWRPTTRTCSISGRAASTWEATHAGKEYAR